MKDINVIKEKLKKLFAMMEDGRGASQQEVETAMKVARKLMAEYKLSMKDIEIKDNVEVLTVKIDGIDFSTQVNPWALTLLNVVADNYCCHPVVYTAKGAKVRTGGLIGFGDDLEIARKVLKYAYDSILAEYQTFFKTESERKRKIAALTRTTYSSMTAKEKTASRNAYGNGYVRGIKEAFEEQNRVEASRNSSAESRVSESTNSFAMVMVTPEEVRKVAEGMKKSTFDSSNATRNARNYDEFAVGGYWSGKNFSFNGRLEG